MILLCLLFIAVRHCPRPWAMACGLLAGGALLLMVLIEPDLLLVGLILVGVIAGLAGYLRSLD
ncbi:hypothetical protein [Streptomyces dysideae]|uniref:hypothetical protein n=1 Tax=Streptomyces dysideae TaxID=909626 RepID=UPI000AB53F56|nr:hypothetical protein [Streptomyces dysideae]